jgi:hypothetical protein
MSQLEVDKIVPQSGTTLTIGDSGDTINFADGQNISIDTNTLYIDSTNNRVGIGTASPSRELSIGDGTSSPNIQLLSANNGNSRIEFGDTDDSDVGEIQYDHFSNFMRFFINGSEAMRINSSGNVGIGTSNPQARLNINASSEASVPALGNDTSFLMVGNDSSGTTNYGTMFGTLNTGNGYIQQQRFDGTATSYNLLLQPNGGKIGIGTSSPTQALDVNGLSYPLVINSTNGNLYKIQFKDNGVGRGYIGCGSTAVFSFADASASEKMRIDSSGNVLVGTTSSIPGIGNTTLGASLRNNGGGSLAVSRGGDNAGYFNRNTSDGSIVSFRKDGTEVGSIGTVGSRLNIGTSNTGLFFNNNQPSIEPADVANSTTRDNAIDLGSSDERFKSLYLSEGIYFQGGSDAVKLDDYEEGTFTPTIEGSSTAGTASYSNQAGKYTKIGNMIAIQIQLSYSGGTGSGTAMYIKGLPFTSNSALIQTLAVAYTNNISMPTNRFVRANIAVNTDFVRLFTDETGGGASNDLAYDGAGDIAVGGIYFV